MKATLFAEEHGFKYPCVAGSVTRNNETHYVWAVFNRKDVPEADIAAHGKDQSGYPYEEDDLFDLGIELTSWQPFSRGIGRMFGAHPRTIIGRNRILVIQMRALDV